MLIIGIAGGSGSGKTTVVNKIINQLPKDQVTVMSQDAYYWDNGHLSQEEKKKINFDHPDSIEWELLIRHLDMLHDGYSIDMPIYTYTSCARSQDTIKLEARQVIIVEGILVLTHAKLRERFDIKTFVDTEADERLMRIIRRDILDRGRDLEAVLKHYNLFVKQMHEQFIEPSKRYANIIIPQGGHNEVGIDILSSRIKMYLE